MKNSYDQLNIEYIEAKNTSPFIKFTTIFLILIFIVIPLPELIDILEYNYAAPNAIEHGYLSGSYGLFSIEPLQFKSLPLSN